MSATFVNGHLLTKCEACGAPASFGIGVDMRRAMAARESGQISLEKRHLGQWWCRPEKTCDNKKENAA